MFMNPITESKHKKQKQMELKKEIDKRTPEILTPSFDWFIEKENISKNINYLRNIIMQSQLIETTQHLT